MNEDVLKPFPCKECVMSFFTEDHLSVHHQAKHGKLNLEIPKGSMNSDAIFADQTPTPTRLLNNCEELRVFDDLQNINPFEEGFRRAVEDGPSINFLQTPSNQDTLHTPQILASFVDRPIKHEEDVVTLPTQDEPENLTISTPNVLEYSNNIPKNTQNLDEFSSSAENFVELKFSQKQPPIPLLPKPSIIYATPIITPTTLHLTESSNSIQTNESVKRKLKDIILSNNGSHIDRKRLKTETVPTILIGTVPLIATSAKLLINNSNNSIGNKLKISSNDVPQTIEDSIKTSDTTNGTKKRIKGSEKPEGSSLKVERNRAAARRYRTKMKIQSQNLQEKYEKSQRELSNLKKEVTELKKELTQVKTILLLHKDCPVAKAMPSNSQLDL